MEMADHGARSALTVGLGGVLSKLKQRFCSHRFALEYLTMVNKDSEGTDRPLVTLDFVGESRKQT